MNFNNIKAVIKKELKDYFDHPLGYILLTVFLGLSNFFFFRAVLLTKEASLRPFFELLPWFLLFLIPAVTMKALAAEQNEGTLEVVLTQPISELELILGKFFGNWLFVLIAISMTLFIPLTLSLGGKLDYGTIFAQYVGAVFLAGGLVAVGILSSALTKNQTVSFIIALFSSFALIIIGLDVVLMGLPFNLLKDVFSELSIMRHFDYISKGVIDLRDIVYFLSLVFIFLSLTYLVFMARKLNRKAKKYKTLQTGIALMIAIAITINLFGSFISFRLDFTGQKLYSLSKGTRKVLNDLDDVLTIKFYASKELPTEVSLVYRHIKDTLQDYKNAAGGKVQLVQKFPDSDEKAKEEAQGQGIQAVQFNIVKSDEFQVKQGYLGVAIEHGDQKESIPFISQTNDLEYQLTSLIRKVSSEEERKIVFTAGHDEKDLQKDLQDLNQILAKQYTIETGTKKDLAKKLKDADVAIVVGPKKKFSDSEKQALKKFIDDGKSVFFLLDTIDINMQYLMASPSKESSADLVREFGIKVNSDIVYDLRQNEQVPFGGGDQGGYLLAYPFWPNLQANPSHIITNQLKQVVLAWVSTLEVDKAKIGKAKAEPLLQTTEYGGRQTKDFNLSPDPKTNALNQKGLKTQALAYAVSNAGKSGKGRMVVLGDSDFLNQEFLSRYPQAAGLLLNSIDWLSQDELLIGIRSKNADPATLLFKSEATKNFVRYFNMVGLVLIIVAYGLWRMNRRRRLDKKYIK